MVRACGWGAGGRGRVKAVVLAAGLGTRLAPLTQSVPKILVPLGGRPLLERQLLYLAANGITHVAVNLHHHADLVLEFLERSDLPVQVRVSHEPELLGTAGALQPLRDFLTEPFVVLYGDVLTDANLAELAAAHARTNGTATLAYYRSRAAEGKGVLELDDEGRVSSFVEKPPSSNEVRCVNAGLYALSPEVLRFTRPGADFGHDVWPAMLVAGEAIYAHEVDGYLRDVGSPEALAEAEADLAARAIRW